MLTESEQVERRLLGQTEVGAGNMEGKTAGVGEGNPVGREITQPSYSQLPGTSQVTKRRESRV